MRNTIYSKGPVLKLLYVYGELIIADDRLDNSQQLHKRVYTWQLALCVQKCIVGICQLGKIN